MQNTSKHTSMFRFPADENRLKIWLENCGKPLYFSKTIFVNNFYYCVKGELKIWSLVSRAGGPRPRGHKLMEQNVVI